MTALEKANLEAEREALKLVCFWLEGFKLGKDGDIYPFGNQTLELLWKLLKRTEYLK